MTFSTINRQSIYQPWSSLSQRIRTFE